MTGTRVLFVDLDGTVRHGKGELGRFVNCPDDVVVFPEAVDRMREWRQAGGRVVAVTNQGGVALGYMSQADNAAIEDATVKQADLLIGAVMTCLHAPDSGCWCRKPTPGLIFHGLRYVHDIHGDVAGPADCLMVGDMESDRECAERAGVPFQWADAWRAGEAS